MTFAVFGHAKFEKTRDNGMFGRQREWSDSGEMYDRSHSMMGRGNGHFEMDYYGATGSITAINGDNLTVKSDNNEVLTVVILEQMLIRNSSRNIVKKSDLKVGNNIRIIGASNSGGVVQAQYIIFE